MDYKLPVYRVVLIREGDVSYQENTIRNSAMVSDFLHAYLADVDREHFIVLFVDVKNHIIGVHTVSMGSLTASVVHPREVFKAAILAQAASIVCGHNHPSADVQPSREDRALTTRLVHAGKLLGITVLGVSAAAPPHMWKELGQRRARCAMLPRRRGSWGPSGHWCSVPVCEVGPGRMRLHHW